MISRLHPLIVHLPIGFIVLGFLLETYVIARKPVKDLNPAIKYTYLAAILASGLAVVTGLLLANNSRYTPSYLEVHKWLGFTVLVISIIVYFTRTRDLFKSARRAYFMSVTLVIAVAAAGHFGGSLTHGPDYLFEYAPEWIKKTAGIKPTFSLEGLNPDSVRVYQHIILPVLDKKCSRCHNEKHPSGGLITTDYEKLVKGGEDDTGIVPGKPFESAILKRVSLPVEDPKYMPPDGAHMSFTEIEIIKYWIERGADTNQYFSSQTTTPEFRALLLRDLELDYTPKARYEKIGMDSIGKEVLSVIEENGFIVRLLAEGNYFLDVLFKRDTMGDTGLTILQPVADHVAFLGLSTTHFTDSDAMDFTMFPNLHSIDLHATNVSDNALATLANLKYLEVLNLYQTPVSAKGVRQVLDSGNLKKVYLWQTLVSNEEISLLANAFPEVEVIAGSILKAPVDTTSNN